MRECCTAYRDGLAPMCGPCADLLSSDLATDLRRDVAAARAEDDADHRDLISEGMDMPTRRDGAL